jgi:hypothetical protein
MASGLRSTRRERARGARTKSRHNHDHRAAGLNHLAFELETEADLVAGYRRAVAGASLWNHRLRSQTTTYHRPAA